MFTPQVIVMTILVFFVLVGIHEWGHYYFAKRAGILVREFALGFGPKLFSFKRGETRYTLRLLPIGGFVRMAGEDPEIVQVQPGQTIAVALKDNQISHIYLDQLDSRSGTLRAVVSGIDLDKQLYVELEGEQGTLRYKVEREAVIVARGTETQIAPYDRQFVGKSVGKRAMSIFAGPMMNFVLAFLLFLVYIWVAGVPEHVKLSKITPDSPASQAGLLQDDLIIAVDGVEVGSSSQRLVDLISEAGGNTMVWNIMREQQPLVVQITPDVVEGKGRVGIEITTHTRSAGVGESFGRAATMFWDFTKEIFGSFKKLILLQFKLDDLGGPIRIVEATGQAANMGINYLILWSALLSLYLGIFNLLPFPALDGSRLLFLGIEAVRGKPVDPARESMVHFIGFAMLMMLMIAVTYNDILRLFKG